MENTKANQQRDADMLVISRALNEIHKTTTGRGDLKMSKLAVKHGLNSKYVASIKKLNVVIMDQNTQGLRINTKFKWNQKGEPTHELAQRIYEHAHSEARLTATRDNEAVKYQTKILSVTNGKNMSKICHTTLKASGTVLKFLDEVHKSCPCTVDEMEKLVTSDEPEETKVNRDIIAYLKKTSFVKEASGNFFWNDDESPSIELAKAVSADLMAEPLEQKAVETPIVETPIPQTNTEMNTTTRKPRKEDHRTLRLKADIKNLLVEGATGKTFLTDPLKRFSNSNVKMIMKPMMEKLDGGKYRMKPFQESPDEKSVLIYEAVQAYQRPILKKSSEVKKKNKEITQSTVVAHNQVQQPSTEKRPEPVHNTALNDVNDLLIAAEELKKLKENIKQQVEQYKSILVRFGYTDARLSTEIADILK